MINILLLFLQSCQKLFKLLLEQRNFFLSLCSLRMIYILLLLLQSCQKLFLFLLQLLNLSLHDFIRIQLLNILGILDLFQNFLANDSIGKLGNFILTMSGLNFLDFISFPFLFPDFSFLGKFPRFLNLLFLFLSSLLFILCLWLRIILLFQPNFPLFYDLMTRKKPQMFTILGLVIRPRDPLSKISNLILISIRTNYHQTLVQDRHHGHQLSSHLFTGHVLDGRSLWKLSSLSLAQISPKMNRSCSMINANLHVIVPGTLNNQSLQMMMAGEL